MCSPLLNEIHINIMGKLCPFSSVSATTSVDRDAKMLVGVGVNSKLLSPQRQLPHYQSWSVTKYDVVRDITNSSGALHERKVSCTPFLHPKYAISVKQHTSKVSGVLVT